MSNRINHQPIFLLATQAWRENSLRVEAFSRDYGRVSLLARSARARGSELRGVLVPFVPVSASWFGKEELKTLHRAEWIGGWQQPKNRSLFSALYVNELVLKLTAREDPQPQLFAALHDILHTICTQNDCADSLRHFEWRLLTELGVAPDWRTDADGAPIQSEQNYLVQPENAARVILPDEFAPKDGVIVSGKLLQELGQGSLNPQSDLNSARQLTRLLLDFRLPDDIQSRKVLQQLNLWKQQIRASYDMNTSENIA
ncbi:DNA repair protein RecO [Wielerella bovis]|uniref:DNA repair protein RecO n=1 Tax=Wielerella bovis TaxID=2917790 RepID=UPI0020193B3C|nr:DNA repair protein RecO [Wielerella bovis]ULJ61090.1 DNA repair protein RecO [Wielerella bovis]